MGGTLSDNLAARKARVRKKGPRGTGVAVALLAVIIAAFPSFAVDAPPLGYRVVRSYPHDPAAFTQGLAYEGGFLYEGTGLEGRSSLRKVDLRTGRVLMRRDLEGPLFGEGITIIGDRIVQLTWRHHLAFVYDKGTFRTVRTFSFPCEAWGIAGDGKRLYISDGTDRLHVLDGETYEEGGVIRVRDGRGPLARLNELEYVRGWIFANVWGEDVIAVIDPKDGTVKARLDLGGLYVSPRGRGGEDCLNGIAYDREGDRLFVTGKLWPRVFELKIRWRDLRGKEKKRGALWKEN